MYSYENYKKFQGHYIKGMKSINQLTFYPNVSIFKDPTGKLKITSYSFNAFFNRRGNLIHLLNLVPYSKNKYSYFYDKEDRIIKILEINKESNIITTENNIIYQDSDNFIEHIRENINTTYERIKQVHHTYENDIRCVELKNVLSDEWYLNQTICYDNIVEEILDSNREWQDVTISELNDKNQIIKNYDFSLEYDDNGEVIESEDKYEPRDYYLYTYYDNGLIKSDTYVSNEPSVKTHEYKFNERNHWIQKITCIDNSLQFICERILEYF